MKKIPLGVIGSRSFSSRTKQWYGDVGFQLKAIANPSEEIQKAAKENGIAAYDDYREMLSDESIEAVYIATPNYMHCEQALGAIEAGKHILCEKPLAPTIAECDRIVEAAEKSRRVFQVGLELRHSKFCRFIVEALSAGEIGKVQMVWCKEFRSPFYPGFENWRLKQAKSGGAFVEKVCHHTDIFDWLIGSKPLKVAAFGGADNVYKNHPVADIIDNGWLMVEYENGARGMLGMCLCLENFDKVELGAVGDSGMLEGVMSESFWGGLPYYSPRIVKSYRANEITITRTRDSKRTIVEIPPAADFQSHIGTYNQWLEFGRCIREGAKPFVDVHVGRSSVLVPFAAERSIKEGRVIQIEDIA